MNEVIFIILVVGVLFLIIKSIEEENEGNKRKSKTVETLIQEVKGHRPSKPDPKVEMMRKAVANGRQQADEEIKSARDDIANIKS